MNITTIIAVIRGLWKLWKESKPAAEAWIKERKAYELENDVGCDGVGGVDGVPVGRQNGGVAGGQNKGQGDAGTGDP